MPQSIPPFVDVAVVIPALDEEESIGAVLDAIPSGVGQVIVADNGCKDDTPNIARNRGATVIRVQRRGYGSACLAALKQLQPFNRESPPDIVVFVDADFSDDPSLMPRLIEPIVQGKADMVIGSRILGECEPGALTPTQRFGSWLSTGLIKLFWNVDFTDLGPFRAIRWSSLEQLAMDDLDFGWTVQMQVRAARRGVTSVELPVPYRNRLRGVSKISGTLDGILKAGTKIIYTILDEAVTPYEPPYRPRERERLIVFTRFPEPGVTKTRMIPTLGPDGAADLQRDMTRHVLDWARSVREHRGIEIEVRYFGGDVDRMQACFGDDLSYVPQGEGPLGLKMYNAFRDAFADGVRHAVAVGADCPLAVGPVLERAFDSLTNHDVVIGPATDGGYYAIGMNRLHPLLFDSRIPWGTDMVLSMTREIIAHSRIRSCVLQPLSDVDTPDDLKTWQIAQQWPASLRRSSP